MPKADSMHRIDFYLNVIEKSGLRVEDRYLDFIFSPEEENYVDNFLKRNMVDKKDFLAVLNPGGNWTLKRWPPDYWARLADGLIGEMGAKVVISGSISDLPLAERIKGVMKEKPLVAGGVFNIKHLAALAKRADLFVTADTGPLHIANAVGAKKIIAIFGPTAREITGPYPDNNVVILQKNVGCSIPCYKVHCRDNRCMKAVVPEEVLAEARKTRKA
jgi:ADP-heptose:LPS heptosyltransferase